MINLLGARRDVLDAIADLLPRLPDDIRDAVRRKGVAVYANIDALLRLRAVGLRDDREIERIDVVAGQSGADLQARELSGMLDT